MLIAKHFTCVLLIIWEEFPSSCPKVMLMSLLLKWRIIIECEMSVSLTRQCIVNVVLFIEQLKVTVSPSWAVVFSGCSLNSSAVVWEKYFLTFYCSGTYYIESHPRGYNPAVGFIIWHLQSPITPWVHIATLLWKFLMLDGYLLHGSHTYMYNFIIVIIHITIPISSHHLLQN